MFVIAVLLALRVHIAPSIIEAYKRHRKEIEEKQALVAFKEKMSRQVGMKIHVTGKLVRGKQLYIEQPVSEVYIQMVTSDDPQLWDRIADLDGKIVEARGTLHYDYHRFFFRHYDLAIGPVGSLVE